MRYKIVFWFIAIQCVITPILVGQDTAFVYLSDFFIKNDNIGYHDVGVGIDYPWNNPDKKLTINGVEYEKGLGTMSDWENSYLEYDLDNQFIKFTAIVGLDDQSLIKEDEFTYTFEWILIDTAGNVIRQYRGCGSEDRTSSVCDSIDNFIPYWPGNDDNDNDWVKLYIDNTPDRRIIMTRPSCQARVLLDDSAVYNSGYITKSESYNSLADTIEIALVGKDKLKLDIIADGLQYDPFDEPIMLKRCPWRDMLDWADAKLYYEKSVTGIDIERNEISMIPERPEYLNMEVFPSNAKMTMYKMESSNPDVVMVLNRVTGKIWSKQPGIATITVTSIDGNYKDSCIVEVKPLNLSVHDERSGTNFIISNPATANNICIRLQTGNTINMDVKIFDLSGKCVWSKSNVNEKSISLDLSGTISEGLYIVSIRNKNNFYAKKLIINK